MLGPFPWKRSQIQNSALWWRSYPREDSCCIGTDKVEIQPAIDFMSTMEFGQHVEVASLEVTEEMMAMASFPQAPYVSNHLGDTYQGFNALRGNPAF